MPASRSRVGRSVSSSHSKSSSSSSSLGHASDVLYKPTSSTTRTEDDADDEGETNDDDKHIWDLEKRGIPKCCICFDLPFRPVRLPCKCNSIVCFECFEQFIKSFSSCMICRELIVSRLRRQCQRRGWHVLIDERLGNWIQAQYSSSTATSSATETDGVETDKAMTEMAVRIIRPPDPGELKREAETLMEKFLNDRKAEEEASLTFLESLKRQGDADILEVERLQTDEELARKLMKEEEEERLKKSKSSASSIQPEPTNNNTIVIIDEEEEDKSTSSQAKNELEIVAFDGDTLPSSPLRMEDDVELFNSHIKDDQSVDTRKKRFIKKSFTVASVFGSGSELAGTSDGESIKKRLRKVSTLDSRIGSGSKRGSLSVSSSAITDLTTPSMTSSSSSVALPVVSLAAKGSLTTTETTLKTWTCRSCTYALTDIKWLRCDLCRSPKHV